MRHLPVDQAQAEAITADTPFEPQYWLMMQIAMIFGYATSFPMNWQLIRAGLKEAM